MKGTIIDFLNLANQNQELAKELVELAARHDFTFDDELNDEDLEKVAGGTVPFADADGCVTVSTRTPPPIPSAFSSLSALGSTGWFPPATDDDGSAGTIPSSDTENLS